MPEILRIRVTGMGGSCENVVKDALKQLDGVEGVTVSYKAGLVAVSFDAARATAATILARVEALGYNAIAIG